MAAIDDYLVALDAEMRSSASSDKPTTDILAEKIAALRAALGLSGGGGGGGGGGGATASEISAVLRLNDAPSSAWVPLVNYSAAPLGSIIETPADNAFVALGTATSVNRLEIWLKDLVPTQAPASLVFAIYSSQGTGPTLQKRLLTTIGVTAGENGASVLSGNAFIQAGCIFIDVNQSDPDLKFAVVARFEPTTISIAADQYNSASRAKWLGANPGFSSTGVLCSVAVNGSVPAGLAGQARVSSYSSDSVSVVGPAFSPTTPLRINLFQLPAFYAPPLGISGICFAKDIDVYNRTFNIKFCAFDFRLLVNTSVRIRIPPNCTIPSVNNAALGTGTTYYVINCTGSVGNQTFQLSLDGTVPVEITSPGAGFFAIFPYPVVTGITLNASNQLVFGGNVIDLQEAISGPVSLGTVAGVVGNAGTASVFTDTAHGYSANDAVILNATTVPTGGLIGARYYVSSNGLTANTFKVSATPNGLPMAFSAAGTNIVWTKESTGVDRQATMSTVGVPAVLVKLGAYIGTNVPFTLGGTTRPGAAYTYSTLRANFLSAHTFNAFDLPGQGFVAFESAGTAVTISALPISLGGTFTLEPTQIWAKGTGEGDVEIALSSGGASVDLGSIGTGIIGITPVNPPLLSGSLQARAAA